MAHLRVIGGGGSYPVSESLEVVNALLDSRPEHRQHDPLMIGRPVSKFITEFRGQPHTQYSVEQVHRLPVDRLRVRR